MIYKSCIVTGRKVVQHSANQHLFVAWKWLSPLFYSTSNITLLIRFSRSPSKNFGMSEGTHLKRAFQFLTKTLLHNKSCNLTSQGQHTRKESNFKACPIVRYALTHFWSMFPFYTPWKYQKTFGKLQVLNSDISQRWVNLLF